MSTTPSTLAKLTSISTHTLSLLLERQRAVGLRSSVSSAGDGKETMQLHLAQITKNLGRLREGICVLEREEGRTEAVRLLRAQFERMRGMLGGVGGVERLQDEDEGEDEEEGGKMKKGKEVRVEVEVGQHRVERGFGYTPYKDDPVSVSGEEREGEGEDENGILLTQRRMMDEQDAHLDRLGHSISRQHHISLQINDELDVHRGLLEELDTDVERTEGRLGRARRGLDRVAKGVKGNGSTVAIGGLIFVLLVLIIVFKT